VDLARRPTGGRELLHDGDLSFSIVAPSRFEKSEAIDRSREFFFKVGQVITSGLASFGIKTLIEPGTLRSRKISGAPCLIATSRYEIKADGKKLVPMAQRLYSGSMLVHGSISLKKSPISTASLLKTDNPDSLQNQIDESSTDLYQLSKKKIDIVALRRELELRFEEVFEGSIEHRNIPKTILTKALASKLKWEINKKQQ
jgi:lipoate-protein ligase A